MKECPHCYNTVIPREDGTCPSCGRKFSDIKNINSSLTSLDIKEGHKLPAVCFLCGIQSDTHIIINKKIVKGGEHWFTKLVILLIHPETFFFEKGLHGEKREVYLKLPICNQCKAKNEKIEPKYVDFNEGFMTFIVHKRFKESLLNLKGESFNAEKHMKGLLNFEDIDNLNLLKLKLFRYYKMDDFLKTLESKTLCLKKPHCWNDPFENLFLKSKIIDVDEKPIEMGIMKERVFAQCWSLKEESDLMWNSYVPDNVGVKVEVSIMNLNQEIQNNTNIVFIGKVKYLTVKEIEQYFSQTFNLTLDEIAKPIFESLLIKRKEFSEEHEVRILFFDLFRNNKSDRIFIVNKNPDDYKDDFKNIPIYSELFEKVVFHPRMSDKEVLKFKSKIQDIGYKGDIEKSKLYNIPDIKIRLDHEGKLSPAPNKQLKT